MVLDCEELADLMSAGGPVKQGCTLSTMATVLRVITQRVPGCDGITSVDTVLLGGEDGTILACDGQSLQQLWHCSTADLRPTAESPAAGAGMLPHQSLVLEGTVVDTHTSRCLCVCICKCWRWSRLAVFVLPALVDLCSHTLFSVACLPCSIYAVTHSLLSLLPSL
jgi:hypothetical protein